MAATDLLSPRFRAARRLLFAAALAAALERAAHAKTDVDFVVNSMYQSGKGGKQVYDGGGDQTLTIYEPVLYINSQIDHNTSVFGSAVLDVLSSASAKAFDHGTGASGGSAATGASEDDGGGDENLFGGWQTRVGADAGYSKRVGAWAFTPTLGFSHELSYNSRHAGLSVQRFFAEDNFVLSAGGFHFADEANPWDIARGKFAGFRPKTTNSLNASATQLLSEKDIVLGGLSYTRQSGFLEGTRNTVSTGTVTERASESLPGGRDKLTANIRYVRSLAPALAFHLDYRRYFDSWHIRADTWEPSLVWSYADEKGLVRLNYRRYSQSAAKYYADGFAGVRPHMTSDSDLAKFTADEYGLQYDYTWEPESAEETVWSLGGTALSYKRSNGLSALVFQAALKAKF